MTSENLLNFFNLRRGFRDRTCEAWGGLELNISFLLSVGITVVYYHTWLNLFSPSKE
jgi:hypothetical protein